MAGHRVQDIAREGVRGRGVLQVSDASTHSGRLHVMRRSLT